MMPPTPVHSPNSRKYSQPEPANVDPNPDTNPGVLDGQEAPRASPDAENSKEKFEEEKIVGKKGKTVAAPATSKLKVNGPPLGSSSLSDLSDHWHLQQNLHLQKKYPLPKMPKDIIQKVMTRRMPTLKRLLLRFHGHPQSAARIYHCRGRADSGMPVSVHIFGPLILPSFLPAPVG